MTLQLPAAAHFISMHINTHMKPFSSHVYSKKKSPLTLVGSPPVIHLLQWKLNTMDPPVKFPGSRTKTQQSEPNLKHCGVDKNPRAGDERCTCVCVIKPGCFSQGTVCKQREKVVSSNSCFPKWSYPCVSQSARACGGSHSSVGWSQQHTLHSEHQTLTHYASFFFSCIYLFY